MKRIATVVALFVFSSCGVFALAEDWPQAAHDAARTGRAENAVSPPFRTLWTASWKYENVATVSQLVVGDGLGYIGTLGQDGSLAGKARAISLADGKDAWLYDQLQGGVANTLAFAALPPEAGGPTVYAATTAGEVVALAAKTGQLKWSFTGGLGGFVTSPLVAEKTILLGGRDGRFYALNLDGSLRWSKKVGAPICNSAAAADGIVYFVDESIRVHALSIASGEYAAGYPSEQLPGGTARNYWPVVAGDYLLIRVAPPHKYNWGETDGILFAGQPGVARRQQADYGAIATPDQERAEQERVIAWLQKNPASQVLHCLARNSGKPACTPGVLYAGGSGDVGPPPVLTRDGRIVAEYRSYYSQYDSTSWVNPFTALGTLDPKTGIVTQIRPYGGTKKDLPWGHIWIIADESSAFSVGGDLLYVAHQGNFGLVELLGERRTFAGPGKRDTWGGYPALTWNRQEWHGGPRSPLSLCDGVAYYVVGARVIAIAGK